MSKYNGVAKILRFNWPWYAGTVALTAVGIPVLRSGMLSPLAAVFGAALLFLADFWLLASLAVSHYVYDRSPVARGDWLAGEELSAVRRAAIFHAGQNEASDVVARLLPSIEVHEFDFYDAARNGTPSLKRARRAAECRAVAIGLGTMPLRDATLDLALVVFAAHEIRRDQDRAVFFRALARPLAPAGRLFVVEHLRDGWNFLAYGPGAFHFFPRNTWRRSFADGGLRLLSEKSCTPFVRVFELGRIP